MSNASNAQQLYSDIEIKNALNAQQLYSDIVNCNNPPNTLNTCQEIYSDIKNSSNALHGQQIFSDVRNASKAQQQLLYSDIKNSSKQLQEQWLQKLPFCVSIGDMPECHEYDLCSLLNDAILLNGQEVRFPNLYPATDEGLTERSERLKI